MSRIWIPRFLFDVNYAIKSSIHEDVYDRGLVMRLNVSGYGALDRYNLVYMSLLKTQNKDGEPNERHTD